MIRSTPSQKIRGGRFRPTLPDGSSFAHVALRGPRGEPIPCNRAYVSVDNNAWDHENGTFVLPLQFATTSKINGVPPPSWTTMAGGGASVEILISVAVDHAAMAREREKAQAVMGTATALWGELDRLRTEQRR